jgi:hypothetical protein
MTRFARVAATAVLAALSVCAQASAAFATGQGVPAVRLDADRVFSAPESWFAFFSVPARTVSFVTGSVFNIAMIPELPLPAPSAAAVAVGSGVAHVNFAMPAPEPLQYVPSAPRVSAAPIQIPTLADEAPPRVDAPSQPIADEHVVEPPRFGNYEPYAPTFKAVGGNATVPVRVGGVRFEGAFHAMQVCGTADEASACSSLRDTNSQNFTAGTNFNVRTGGSSVKVQLSSSIEHLTNEAAGIFPYVPLDPDAQAGLSYYGLTDVVKHGVNAQVDVPVAPRVTIGLQYDRSHYQGDYNTTLLPGFDARRDTYLGNVTYQLPNTTSAITLSARQYRYQDAFAPNFNLTQTRADLNFTVKF